MPLCFTIRNDMEFYFSVNGVGYLCGDDDVIGDYWTRVSISIKNAYFNWSESDGEAFTFGELINLRDSLNTLLSDGYSEPFVIRFIEPNYEFLLTPKTDLRTIIKGVFKDPVRDVFMEFIVNITYGGFGDATERYTLPFHRNAIIAWRDYLDEVISKLDYRGKLIDEYPHPDQSNE